MEVRFRLDEVYRITGIGVVAVGVVTQGRLTVGMVGTSQGYAFTVKTIEREHQQMQAADVGEKIGISLADADFSSLEASKGREIPFSDTPPGIARKPAKGFFDRLFGR